MIYYLNVAVYTKIDHLLTYKLDSLKKPERGVRVLVPLGNKLITGIIVDVIEDERKIRIERSKIKEIKEIIDENPVLSEDLLKLGIWISDYYISSPGIVFSTILSSLHKIKTNKIINLLKYDENLKGHKKEIIDFLKSKKDVSLKRIAKELKIKNIYSLISELKKNNIIEVKEKEVIYGVKEKIKEPEKDINSEEEITELTDEQKIAIEKIKENILKNTYKTFLLFGITGSGKTEVYIKAAEEAIKNQKKVIVLVPEIFLTPQILERFKKIFGGRIAIYHSGLTKSERLNEWKKIKQGEVDLVIGTRSAIFSPFENLGLIIVDEEFDTSYKQENDPRYNARDVAVMRGYLTNATVILGSATPSLESFNNAEKGKYEILNLTKRVKAKKLPDITIIDLKNEKDWPEKFLTDTFIKKMEMALLNNEQAILFINRRGFSNFIICYKCGFVLKCKNCEIILTYHKEDNKIKCHYCNYEKDAFFICSKCNERLFYKGMGTQKVEDVIKKFFPDKNIARIDIDSMKNKKQYFEIYKKMKEKKIDIMIGTQMIAKGFDLPEVTFVGVVNIDNILNLPDFRAEERVFQLLMQVAGRCGRAEKEGEVVVQTFSPDNLAIKFVKDYKIKEFFKEQLEIRKMMEYPPFFSITQIIIQNQNKEKCEKKAEEILEKIQSIMDKIKIKTIKILGPAEAPLFKIKNKYRYSILLKGKSKNDLNIICKEIKKIEKGSDIIINVDPINIL